MILGVPDGVSLPLAVAVAVSVSEAILWALLIGAASEAVLWALLIGVAVAVTMSEAVLWALLIGAAVTKDKAEMVGPVREEKDEATKEVIKGVVVLEGVDDFV